MPTYLYKDIQTGETYEFKQSINDAPLTAHPETGAALKRLVSAPGIAFKGSGFYVNDSRAQQTSGSKAASKETKKEPSSAGAGSKDAPVASQPVSSVASTPASSGSSGE